MGFREESTQEDETSLLRRAASWPDHSTLDTLTGPVLQRLTTVEGIDFATTLLFDRLRKSDQHAAFIERIDRLRREPNQARRLVDVKLAVIPGALYVERPDMGGDGRLIHDVAQKFGWHSTLVPLASRGAITENTRRLNAWLAQQTEEKLVLVSLSKGGAEVKLALSQPNAPRLFRKVIAWVNVCGLLDGSPMVNWVLSSRLRTWLLRCNYWLQRRNFGFVTDLRHGSDATLNFPLHPPPGLKMVSLVGFPLRRHMTTPFSRFCHRRLAAWGPNDGTVPLSNLSRWPGHIYPVWSADHYFRPEHTARSIIAAVLHLLAEESIELPERKEQK